MRLSSSGFYKELGLCPWHTLKKLLCESFASFLRHVLFWCKFLYKPVCNRAETHLIQWKELVQEKLLQESMSDVQISCESWVIQVCFSKFLERVSYYYLSLYGCGPHHVGCETFTTEVVKICLSWRSGLRHNCHSVVVIFWVTLFLCVMWLVNVSCCLLRNAYAVVQTLWNTLHEIASMNMEDDGR